MTETTSIPAAASGELSSKKLPELKQLASGLGIKGTGSMRKSALIEAIAARQNGATQTTVPSAAPTEPAREQHTPEDRTPRESAPTGAPDGTDRADRGRSDDNRDDRRDDAANRDGGGPDRSDKGHHNRSGNRDERGRSDRQRDDRGQRDKSRDEGQRDKNRDEGQRDKSRDDGKGDKNRDNQNRDNQNRDQNRDNRNRDDNDGGGRGRRRRNRGRDRNRGGGRGRDEEPVISEDDVLVPVAGILDMLDNYAFVRTSGYLPGPNDVYVSMGMVKKHGLRKGDAVTGQIKQNDGQQQGGGGGRREKYTPIARIDTVNGTPTAETKERVEFSKLTPLYPNERLRLETEPGNLIGRVIDIAAPIGKGQRGLIVSPAKAGKTMIMQSIANSITANNPECHLMVVLVDERPEEVTDFQRSVRGEVISSTFDRPAGDHTQVSELAIERAKRLVEMGHDVVVLLDGITRLGRAYNLAAPASGRILSGGVDSAALYPPKRFFGAARNIEHGGSLTILATALIESGSKMDEVIFEEFKGTGNMEIRLRRDFADKRLFPAIDAVQSGTRREELLMSREELSIVWKLRRVLSALDGQQALELLLGKLKSTKTNPEFLMQVNKTTPTVAGLRGDDD